MNLNSPIKNKLNRIFLGRKGVILTWYNFGYELKHPLYWRIGDNLYINLCNQLFDQLQNEFESPIKN